MLAAGDIVKADRIKWNYTIKECELYIKYRQREILFRELILALLGGDEQAKDSAPVRRDKAIGEYCNGRDVEECRQYFGDMLAQVCATCPQ